MKTILRLVLLISIFTLSSSITLHRIDFRHGMNKNVCKSFRNEVLAYFVFVDSKETSPWTEYDMRSTLDSITIALNWLNKQADKHNINARIRANYYVGNPYSTIKKDLAMGTVQKTLTTPSLRKGIIEMNSWADAIAKKVGGSVTMPEKDGIPETKNPKNKERLIAHLRDENNVESVALIFLVNNYFRDDISATVNTFNANDVEFAVVSYKYPAEIAHNILALFGGAPLYKSTYRRNENKIKKASELFANDIMQDPYAKSINKLEIGPLSQYLIGWTDKLNTQYTDLLTDGLIIY